MADPIIITPYNFVPLGKVVEGDKPPSRDCYHDGVYTGWFDYEVETLTPTYTRTAAKVKWDAPEPVQTKSQQPYDFFHRGDRERTPVLPGSSVRGMFRSVFEILTNSRMEFVSQRRLFYRSFADTAKSGKGTLYRENYDLSALRAGIVTSQPDGTVNLEASKTVPLGFVVISIEDPILATLHNNTTHEKLTEPMAIVQNGAQVAPVKRDTYKKVRVWVLLRGHDVTLFGMPNDKSGTSGLKIPEASLCPTGAPGAIEGWLIVPGPEVNRDRNTRIPKRRWHQVILIPDQNQGVPYNIPRRVEREYESWGDTAHGHKFKEQAKPLKVPRKVNRDGEPAFVLLDSSRTTVAILGANMMLPICYERAIDDVVKANYTTLHNGKAAPNLDMADAVFGRVQEKAAGDETAMIRSRVFFEDAVYLPRENTVPFLDKGTPKMPDILSSPKPTSIKTYLEQPDNIDRPGVQFRHWNSPDLRIRGFKRYWHRSDQAAQASLGRDINKLDKQDTLIRPVCTHRFFRGRIRFENLSSAELGALYATIQLPEGLAHKFGMAKSLGLGSIRVTVTNKSLFSMKDRYLSFMPSAGKSETPDTILKQAYGDFVRKICGEQATSLWQSERLRSLAALLSWEDQLNPIDTRMVMIRNKENEHTFYQNMRGVSVHNDHQWGTDKAYFLSTLDLFGREWKLPEDVFALPEPPSTPKGKMDMEAYRDLSAVESKPARKDGKYPKTKVTLVRKGKPGRGIVQVEAVDGEYPCSNLPTYLPAEPGESFHAEVTFKNGKPTDIVVKTRI